MNRLLLGFEDKIPYLLSTLEDFPCTIIDPTGKFAPAAANITQHPDAIYFDPSDVEHPVGLNLLDIPPTEVCLLLNVLYPGGETTLTNLHSNVLLLAILSVVPKSDTILGVLKFLKDDTYRTNCIRRNKDPIIKLYWDFIDHWDEKQFAAAAALIFSKIGALLEDPALRHILCQPYSTLTKPIVIANLDRSKIGDLAAKVLGYVLLRRPDRVYIHDLGFFSSDYLAPFFAQERYTVTVQFLRELTPKLRETVLAFPNKAVFRTNREDAEALYFYFGLGNASVFMDLSSQQVQTLSGPITPTAPRSLRSLAGLRKYTRAEHSRPRREIEAAIAKFLTLPPAP